MKRTNLIAIPVTVILSLAGIATIAGAFTQTERDTISRMKARITALETKMSALATTQDDIATLYANDQGISSDIDTLNANDQTINASLQAVDTGLKGLVSTTGPLSQLNEELLALDAYVKDHIPPIELTAITPTVTCDGTNCTVDVAWDSNPPATGQVEWGKTLEYGNLTKKEVGLLAHHQQRIGTFPQDGSTYHYRILATTPTQTAIDTGSFTAQ